MGYLGYFNVFKQVNINGNVHFVDLDTLFDGLVATTVRTQDVVILGYETSADK